MTIAPPERELVDDACDEDGKALTPEIPDHGTGVRRARRAQREAAAAAEAEAEATQAHVEARPSGPGTPTGREATQSSRQAARRWQRTGFAVAICLLAAAIPVLGLAGFRALTGSTAGRMVNGSIAPDQPNYEAIVEPTATALVVQRDGNVLRGLTLLALGSGDHGGGVLFLPISTVVGGGHTLADVFADGGAPAVQQAVAGVIGTGIGEVVDLDAARWAGLVDPVAPVVVANPDDVVIETSPRRVAFAAGEVSLQGADVARFLATSGIGQNDLARLGRNEAFWSAWLGAVAAASNQKAAVPGEVQSGIGRFVRALAAGVGDGSVDFATLPVDEDGAGSDGGEHFTPRADAIVDVMARLVPLPTSPGPGSGAMARVRVRLLRGTSDSDSAGAALVDRSIRELVQGGAQISIIGNADKFTYATTAIEYAEPSQRAAAERLQAALGVGAVSQVEGTDETIDVTVVLGRDYATGDNRGSASTKEQPTGRSN